MKKELNRRAYMKPVIKVYELEAERFLTGSQANGNAGKGGTGGNVGDSKKNDSFDDYWNDEEEEMQTNSTNLWE